MPHVEHDAGVLLGHSNEGEIEGRPGRREEPDERLVLQQDKRGPGLEVVEEFRGRNSALDGGVAVVGGGTEEVAREIGVLVENEDDLVRVKPAIPQVRVNRTQRRPEIHES